MRTLRYHVRQWGPDAPQSPDRTLFLLHGFMDVSASFQFLVDCLPATVRVIAPDWRGFGLTERSTSDSYWFPDYLADLDALLAHYSPDQPARLVGHSMGGNVAMLYAGTRPQRVERLVSLEGIGLRGFAPDEAPHRYEQWLGELREPARLRDYPSLDAVAERLRRSNPRLPPDKAAWLATHWAAATPGGRFELRADPAHRRVNPDLYRCDEAMAIWRRIAADVLMVLSDRTDIGQGYLRSPEFADRLAGVPSLRRREIADSGHMLHHDQPRAVARLIEEFLLC